MVSVTEDGDVCDCRGCRVGASKVRAAGSVSVGAGTAWHGGFGARVIAAVGGESGGCAARGGGCRVSSTATGEDGFVTTAVVGGRDWLTGSGADAVLVAIPNA